MRCTIVSCCAANLRHRNHVRGQRIIDMAFAVEHRSGTTIGDRANYRHLGRVAREGVTTAGEPCHLNICRATTHRSKTCLRNVSLLRGEPSHRYLGSAASNLEPVICRRRIPRRHAFQVDASDHSATTRPVLPGAVWPRERWTQGCWRRDVHDGHALLWP
jgi:hypothetical protein